MTLDEIQRIKKWHVAHRLDHPVEYHLWDLILTFWVMGLVGWLPGYVFEQWWLIPLSGIAMAAPTLYVGWRRKAHRARTLRCDWIRQVPLEG
ncbi:MAG: hypothetical protein V4684_04825 [Pseudomonadota bacterium]